jgi:Biotin carboxylase
MTSIAIVEPASSGVRLIDAAKAMGLDVFVLSYNRDDRTLPEHQRRQLDGIIEVDTNDKDALTAAVYELHSRVRLSGILPGCEYYVPSVTYLNAHFGLPGLLPTMVNAARHKDYMRDRLTAEGVEVPKYVLVQSADQLNAASEQVGFPAVLKPVNSAGSIHVSKVTDATSLRQAYAALRAETRADLGHT